MAYISIEKNMNEFVVVRASSYMDHELIDARIFYTDRKTSELKPTRKGFSINVDLVPDLIEALEALVCQRPTEDMDEQLDPLPSDSRLNELANNIKDILGAHGTRLHWDSIYKMVVDQHKKESYTIQEIRYCLVTNRGLFQSRGGGVYTTY
jgi:hypothetical protein